MPLDPDRLLNWRFAPVEQLVTPQACMLYGLSLGLGGDPLDANDLRFVYEKDLAVVPTMPVVLGHPGPWQDDPASGVTRSKVVHGEQGLVVHAPLVPGRTVRALNRIVDVVDKGSDKGALIYMEREIADQETGARLATTTSTVFCRADGGFGQRETRRREAVAIPSRAPDLVGTVPTRPGAALLYRLNGDMNPLHADPALARAAGFERPILHGLCTYGLAGVALLKTLAGGDPLALMEMSARFSSPVLPGDVLSVEVWDEGHEVRFRVRVPARGATALDGGRAVIRRAGAGP